MPILPRPRPSSGSVSLAHDLISIPSRAVDLNAAENTAPSDSGAHWHWHSAPVPLGAAQAPCCAHSGAAFQWPPTRTRSASRLLVSRMPRRRAAPGPTPLQLSGRLRLGLGRSVAAGAASLSSMTSAAGDCESPSWSHGPAGPGPGPRPTSEGHWSPAAAGQPGPEHDSEPQAECQSRLSRKMSNPGPAEAA